MKNGIKGLLCKAAKRGLAVCLAVALAVSTPSPTPVSAAKKTKPTLTVKRKTLYYNHFLINSYKLRVKKNNAKVIVVTDWSTSNKKVVSLSSKKDTSVKLTANSKGTATITANIKYVPKGSYDIKKIRLKCKVTSKLKKIPGQATAAPTVNQEPSIPDNTEEPSIPDNTEEPSTPTSTPVNTEEPSIPTSTPDNTDKPSTPTSTPDNTEEPSIPTSTPDNTVPVTRITMSDSEKELDLNGKVQLTADVMPEDATDKSIIWNSSDTSVATVSELGMVTAEGEGTADITASTPDGKYSAKCSVTVSSKAVVSTNDEIESALSKPDIKTLEISSDTDEKLTVPEGTYEDVDMIVNLPNGELENNAKFKNITINKIAQNTFYENAVGNIIKILTEKSHIVIGENATASIVVSEDSLQTEVENNGDIKSLQINCQGRVDISGASEKKIPVEIKAEAKIFTTKPLDIDAKERFDITIRPGAESTAVTVDAEVNVPGIFGIGMISVKITATGEIKNIIGENNGPDELAEQVNLTGVVNDMDGKAVQGADIYIAFYSDEYNIEDISNDDKAIHLKTDADGKYSTEDKIVSGNYYLVAKKDGYMDVSQKVLITSTYGDTYTNEDIILIPAEWQGKTGNVTGKILDSEQKDLAIEGITVKIRKGKGTLDTGAHVEKETRTDEQGIYTFYDMEAGYYTIELKDENEEYHTTWINVLIRPDTTVTEGAVMSKLLLDGQLRFILSWGSEDSGAVADLDAHLRGPEGYGNYRFHTYFNNKKFENGEYRADLDVDDMDYEGPETTTIYESAPGVYSYYVHNYTDRYEKDSTSLSESSVRVEVYDGNYKQNTYYIPKKNGTVWHVFDYDSNTKRFKTVNTMYYERQAQRVGYTVDEYKGAIESYLSSIQNCYESLEAGTGDDISAIIQEYRQRLTTLADTQENEAAKLFDECYDYYHYLYNETRLSCYGEDIVAYTEFTTNKFRIEVAEPDFEPTNYVFSSGNETIVEEFEPMEAGAWKTVRLTAKTGHVKVYHVYKEFDLSGVHITDASIGEENLHYTWEDSFWEGDLYYYNTCLYSEHGTDFALEDVALTFSINVNTDAIEVQYDSHKIDGGYTVTIKNGVQEKTWVLHKYSAPNIEGDNQIYGIQYSGNSLYVYADNKEFAEGSALVVDGKQYELRKEKSEPNYSYYYCNTDNAYYYIYCYSMEYACGLSEVRFYGDVTTVIDKDSHSVTVTAGNPDMTADDLEFDGGNVPAPHYNTNIKYEKVSGEEYAGIITVTLESIDNYSNTYETVSSFV